MEIPDFDRGYETGVRVVVVGDDPLAFWRTNLEIVRFRVAPVLRGLMEQGVINWYCSLLHGQEEGAPTVKGDPHAYQHIRVALAPGRTADELRAGLPPDFLPARPMTRDKFTDMPDHHLAFLRDGDTRRIWQRMGEMNELQFRILDDHRPDLPIPEDNLWLMLHYACSMWQIWGPGPAWRPGLQVEVGYPE
jgi:hypothetical protein